MDAYTLLIVAACLVLLWRDIARSNELVELRAHREHVAQTVQTTRAAVHRALTVAHDALPADERHELAEELRRWRDV